MVTHRFRVPTASQLKNYNCNARIPLEDYHLLNRILVDESDAVMEAYAAEVLKLAEMYKSTLDLSDVSDADKRPNGGSMVPRCVADLKPGVFDAPLRGFGA
jgi:hypothetical protein